MSSVGKDGDFGSLCHPYWRNWGQSPNSEILRTVPKFSLAPHQGSGGEWLPDEGSSVSAGIRIRHLRCLPHSGPCGFGNVAAASGPLRGSGGEWKQNDAPLVSQNCGRTSVRPYNPRTLRAYALGYDRRLVQGSGGGAAGSQAKACGSVGANETSLGVRSVTRAMILEKAHV